MAKKQPKWKAGQPHAGPRGWEIFNERNNEQLCAEMTADAMQTVLHALKVSQAAAELVAKLGARAEVARELAYRLYTLCERKKRATEALAYNGLVQSWPEVMRLAHEGGRPKAEQVGLFEEGEE